MTREQAFAFIAENGPTMTLALNLITDRTRPDHPMGVLQSERLRAERSGLQLNAGTEAGTPFPAAENDLESRSAPPEVQTAGSGEEDSGPDVAQPSITVPSSAPAPSPALNRCGLAYDVDECALPLGHSGECRDSDGLGLEIPF